MIANRFRRVAASMAVVAGLIGATSSPVAAACGDAPAPEVDWRGCDRTFFELSDLDLSGANLAEADLSYAVLFRTNLSGANLAGANLQDAFPVGANLTRANLRRANLADADFVAAVLTNADLRSANLAGADLDLATIGGANFVGANLLGTDFTKTTGADRAIFVLAPVGVDDTTVAEAGGKATIRVLSNDDPNNRNPRAVMSYEVIEAPANGSFNSRTGVYTPRPGFTGNDTMIYRPIDSVRIENAPPNAATSSKGSAATVTIRVIKRVKLSAPYAGASGKRGDLVRLYIASLNRAPDDPGFDFWLQQYESGTTLETIAANFLNSSEFLGDTSGLSDDEFVTLLYHNIFIRDPDDGGKSFWLGELKAGMTRARLLVLFSNGPEFKKITGTS